MIEHTVKDDFHPSLVGFLNHLDEQFITCGKIGSSGNPADISACKSVLPLIRRKKLTTVVDDLTEVRVYMIVILYIVLMI